MIKTLTLPCIDNAILGLRIIGYQTRMNEIHGTASALYRINQGDMNSVKYALDILTLLKEKIESEEKTK